MIETFITYLRSIRGFSANTCRAYEKDIRAFSAWMLQHNQSATWRTITRDDIDAYIIEEQKAGLKPSTTNRQLSAISSLYKFFQRQGLECINPCKYESRRKLGSSLPNTIDMQQLRKAYEHSRGLTKMMLGILITTGIRIQEALDLTWEDIDFQNGTIRINGKGSKQRLIKTSLDLKKAAEQVQYLTQGHGRIFYNGQRYWRHMIWQTLTPYCRAKQLSPHAIRHTIATEMAKSGMSAIDISQILGHSHIETSQKYIDFAQLSTKTTGISL